MIDHEKHAEAARVIVAKYRTEMMEGIISWLEEIEIREEDTALQLREKIVENLRDALAWAEKP